MFNPSAEAVKFSVFHTKQEQWFSGTIMFNWTNEHVSFFFLTRRGNLNRHIKNIQMMWGERASESLLDRRIKKKSTSMKIKCLNDMQIIAFCIYLHFTQHIFLKLKQGCSRHSSRTLNLEGQMMFWRTVERHVETPRTLKNELCLKPTYFTDILQNQNHFEDLYFPVFRRHSHVFMVVFSALFSFQLMFWVFFFWFCSTF